jgi:hypothetical protein
MIRVPSKAGHPWLLSAAGHVFFSSSDRLGARPPDGHRRAHDLVDRPQGVLVEAEAGGGDGLVGFEVARAG